MPMSPAELRFLINRTTGLFHRGLASLRTRGLRASWHRVLKQFHRVPASARPALYLPDSRPFAPFAVPHSDAPRASIIIPVFNQVEHTLVCLRALAEHPPAACVEVIVVDDGSSDDTTRLLPQLDGLRFHRRDANGGFIAACTTGAAVARGEMLVFLNNDTVPQPGWLDALLDTFDTHPDSGLVGAQLLYPDGRLQEAGAAIRADGSAEKLGRNEHVDSPLHAFVKRVDYCSAAAIAIPAGLFHTVGGFDPHYAPAFYEDTDLGMQVRRAGRQVRVQPAARVVHVEGVTTGVDTRTGIKQYQVRNQSRFAERWQDALSAHPPADALPASLSDHRYDGMVLVIDALTPQPDRDSGSLRCINLMRMLLQENMGVVFVPASLGWDGDYTRALQQLGVEAWYSPFARSLPDWLRTHGPRFGTVIVSRHYVLGEVLPLLRRFAPQARVVFDTVDLHYLRELRGARTQGSAALLKAAERTRRSELDLINRSDVTLVVSEVERALLAQDAPHARVEVLSNLHELADPGAPFEQRRDIMFVGGFRHPPNVDGVLWFATQVWPRIHAAEPGIVFHCIGGDVPPEISALSAQPGIRVHGHVPDIGPFLSGVRLSVAPLRFGAGVKGKVNLGMAHGQPVVATSCAVEGMHLRDGEDVLVADTPEPFAQAVLRAYRDPDLWSRMAAGGRENVARHFSLEAARAVVRRLLPGQGPAADA